MYNGVVQKVEYFSSAVNVNVDSLYFIIIGESSCYSAYRLSPNYPSPLTTRPTITLERLEVVKRAWIVGVT